MRFSSIFCSFAVTTLPLLAQGSSPVKVTGITVTPASLPAGTQATFTVALQNAGTKAYGCVGTPGFAVHVYVFKAQPYTTTNLVWQGSQALTTPLNPGERRSITLATPWTVPPATTAPTLYVTAWSPVCAPDEFGQNAQIKLEQECIYKFQRTFTLAPIAPRDFKLIRK